MTDEKKPADDQLSEDELNDVAGGLLGPDPATLGEAGAVGEAL